MGAPRQESAPTDGDLPDSDFVESEHLVPSEREGRRILVYLLSIRPSWDDPGWYDVFGGIHSPSKKKLIGASISVRERSVRGDLVGSPGWRIAVAYALVRDRDRRLGERAAKRQAAKRKKR